MSRKAIITIIIAAITVLGFANVYAEDDNNSGAVLNISTSGFDGDVGIYIDNVNAGENTLVGLILDEGDYKISIRPGANYQPARYPLTVKQGKHYNVHFRLAPESNGNSIDWPAFFIAAGITLGVCLAGLITLAKHGFG